MWRKRVGVEPTIRPARGRIAGFEGREGHRTKFASVKILQVVWVLQKPARVVKMAIGTAGNRRLACASLHESQCW